MTNTPNRTLLWCQELLTAIDNAAQLTVSPKLFESVGELWWSRCERNDEIFVYVFSQLLGYPFTRDDFYGASPRLRRGLYSFTSNHMFPGRGVYVAEIVAYILIEGRQEELLNAYYHSLHRRFARLEHERVQRERDYQWVQEVLALLEGTDTPLRFLPQSLQLGEGEIRE
jgi:hypothetical protein